MKNLVTALMLSAAMGMSVPVMAQAHESHQPAQNAQSAQSVEAEGTVTAVDKAAGIVTIKHGPIKALNWPAMTMKFKATPEALASAKVGQKIHFVLNNDNGKPLVTAIHAL